MLIRHLLTVLNFNLVDILDEIYCNFGNNVVFLNKLYTVSSEDESYGKQNMLLDYIIIGVGQENKSPRPHFDPNKLPSAKV